jgi:hypothetical protein
MPEWHARAVEAVSKQIPEPWRAEAFDSLDKIQAAALKRVGQRDAKNLETLAA